jgi:hypothetical protein
MVGSIKTQMLNGVFAQKMARFDQKPENNLA